MLDEYDVDLSNENSLRLPCVARRVITIESESELEKIFPSLVKPTDKYLILGGGSNLILPEYVDQTVLRVKIEGVAYEPCDDQVLVKVGAGELWDSLVANTVEHGFRGIENLSYIPGTVGAAPVQNIGAYGVELGDVLESVRVFDFSSMSIRDLPSKSCGFAYRDSIFKRNSGRFLILGLSLKLSTSRPFVLTYGELNTWASDCQSIDLASVRDKVIEVRRAKLPEPKDTPNAGSFFKNPVVSRSKRNALQSSFPALVSYDLDKERCKLAAGWLIDQAGWKGFKAERAGVHDKQALVLVSRPGAKQLDVLALAKEIQASVYEKFGVELKIEPTVVTNVDT